jgi:hypothetical protein
VKPEEGANEISETELERQLNLPGSCTCAVNQTSAVNWISHNVKDDVIVYRGIQVDPIGAIETLHAELQVRSF